MERLIESVRKFPCLWNMDAQEYKLFDAKNAAWREVVKKCGYPDVKEAKTVWRKLRDGHRQAIARKKAGLAVNSKWKYEKRMEFLLPTMKIRPKTSYTERRENIKENHEDTLDKNDGTHQNEDSSESVQPENNSNAYIQPKKIITVLLEKDKKKRDVKCQRDPLNMQTDSDSARVTQDRALGKFFMSMLLTTRQLPERLQIKVQRQIFNNVMEAKEQSLLCQCNTTYTSPSTIRTSAFELPIQSLIPTGIDESSVSNYSDMHTQSVTSSHLESQRRGSIKSEQNDVSEDIAANY